MRRHPCFVAWKAKLEAQKKLLKKKSAERGSDSDGESDSDDASESDGGSDSNVESKEDNASIDELDDNASNGGESNGDDQAEGDDQAKGDESGLTSNEKKELGSAIETFSNLCHKYGPIRAYDAVQLAPKNWTANDWYVTTFSFFIF